MHPIAAHAKERHSFPLKAVSPMHISSNLQHTLASNIAVSFQRKALIVAAAIVVLAAIPQSSASSVQPDSRIPGPTAQFVPAQLSGQAPRQIVANPDRTFERYGPQATERAVRSSLKIALVPDPLAMGSLIFCAFALRWMRRRRQENPAKGYGNASPDSVLSRAA